MSAISATAVKDLREKTGAGMMDCKRALETSGGDVESAIEWLRKQGIAKAAKKSSRAAKEGVLTCATSADGRTSVMVEVNCETDFVAKNDDFKKFISDINTVAQAKLPDTLDALLTQAISSGTVQETQTALTAKIGENIHVSRVRKVVAETPTQKLGKYIHAGDKIGVIVRYDDPASKLTADAAKDVAMHVAAMDPRFVRRDQIAADVLDKERAIIREQLKDEKKPPEILEKIIHGRVQKFYAEVCLEEQIFVKDPSGKQTVQQALTSLDAGIRILDVVRMQVGELAVTEAKEESAA